MPRKRSPLVYLGLAILVLVAFGLTQTGQLALVGFGVLVLILVPLSLLARVILRWMEGPR